MPAFFAHSRGTVSRVDSLHQNAGGLLPFRILMAGTDIAGPNTRAIITQAAINEKGNYQFLHALDETIYAYVFGDRIGELSVSGMCFSNTCEGGASGMKQIIDAYRANRIAQRGEPVQVSFGEVDYRGFLVGMSLDVADAEKLLGQWTFRFQTFPGNQ